MNRNRIKKHRKRRFQFKKNFVKSIEARTIRKLLFLSKKEASDFLWGIPPLNKKDRLLKPSDSLRDTCINRGISLNESHFPEAYMNTAFLLLTMIEWTNSNNIRDGLIFPAFFCFRHYLELTMKDSINQFGDVCLDESIIQREHNLCKLWTKLSEYIPEGEDTELVHNLMFELNRIDKNGELFRYPYEVGDNGEQLSNSLPSGLFEVQQLKTTMLKIYRFMDRINTLAYLSHENY